MHVIVAEGGVSLHQLEGVIDDASAVANHRS
jgi:hypothetical protein